MAKCPIKSDKFLMALAKRVRGAVETLATHDDLEGYCAIASHFFVNMAKNYGYKLDLVEGVAFEEYEDDDNINHCWVQYQGKIIDLTATQFGIMHEIYIVDAPSNKYHAVRKNRLVIKSLKYSWPNGQTLYYGANNYALRKAREKIIETMEKIA